MDAAAATTTGDLITLAGVDCPAAIDAIASVMPVDLFIDDPLKHIEPSPGLELPPAGKEVQSEVFAAVEKHCGAKWAPVERYAFYAAAKDCFAIVQTAERRPYGCFLITKGVVGPDGKDLEP